MKTLLNQHRDVDRSVINWVPERPIQYELAVDPDVDEVVKAIKQMANGKTPGVDGIPREVLKEGGPVLFTSLHQLIQCIWQSECVPQKWKDSTIIALYKK